MDQRLPELTVVIPLRETDDGQITLESLKKQTYQDFKIIIVKDQGRGANWARNEGFKQVDTPFVLFSDGDIEWKSRALNTMMRLLRKYPRNSYVYGRYKLGNDIWCHQHWDPYALKRGNYISTMSIVRTKDLPNPPFDENIWRLQDWDLWLEMLAQGKRGIYCEDLIFETPLKVGISHGGLNYIDALLIIRKKHKLDE